MCRRVAGCFGTLLLLAVLGLGLLWFDVTRREAGPEPAVTQPPTAAEQQAARRTLRRLEQQVRAPAPGSRSRDDSAAGREPSAFELRVTEVEANQLVQDLPEVRKTLARQRMAPPVVEFEPDRLVVTLRLPLYGATTGRVRAESRVWAEDGRLAHELTGVYLGSLPVPAAVRKQLEGSLADLIKQLNRGIKGRIEEVSVTEDMLQIRGTPPPR